MDSRRVSHYCIVRGDLPRGVMAAQLVHAAGESVRGELPPHTRAVVLAVADEAALLRVAARLHDLGVPHRLIREPDPPWHGAAMSIGVCPIDDHDRRAKSVLARLTILT